MKKMFSSFGSVVLSREQMKGVKGGTEDVEPGESYDCKKACSKSGTCAVKPSGSGCECTTSDGGTC